MVRKFLAWHAENPRELVAVEQQLKVRIGPVEITGRVDRLESDDQGRAVVVDLKTGGSAPRARYSCRRCTIASLTAFASEYPP